MGHDSPLTTLNSYGQLTIEQQAQIIDGIGMPKPDAQPSDDTLAENIAEKVAAKLRRS